MTMDLAAYRASLRAPRRSEETDAQIALFDLLSRLEGRWPLLRYVTHVPNGGKRDKATAARLKAMGVKPGVCDILVFCRNRCPIDGRPPLYFAGLADERKTTTGRLSADQERWQKHLVHEGWYAVTSTDWTDEARLIISWCGGDPSVVEGL